MTSTHFSTLRQVRAGIHSRGRGRTSNTDDNSGGSSSGKLSGGEDQQRAKNTPVSNMPVEKVSGDGSGDRDRNMGGAADGYISLFAPQETHRVVCSTTQGDLDINVYPHWAPEGAMRFLNLVRSGFYTKSAIYRCIPGFVIQWDYGDVEQAAQWDRYMEEIPDDPLWDVDPHPGPFRRGKS